MNGADRKYRPGGPNRSSAAVNLRPIVGFSDAPITAIDFGRKSASRRIGSSHATDSRRC